MASLYAGYYENTAFDADDDGYVKLATQTVINVYKEDGTTPARVFANRARTTELFQVLTDPTGFFAFFVDPGFYWVQFGNTPAKKVWIGEDIADTVSPDQAGVANGYVPLDSSLKFDAKYLPETVPTSATASDPNVIILANQPGFDATGATDMWGWLDFRLPSWANQKKRVVFGPGRVRLSRTLAVSNQADEVYPERPTWLYQGEPPFAFIPAPSFTGTAMRSYGDGVGTFNYATLTNMVCYGILTSNGSGNLAGVDGMQIIGETFGLRTRSCAFRRFGEWGMRYVPVVNPDGTGQQSRGHKHYDLSTESCGTGGIDTDGLTDFDIVRHHAHFIGTTSTSSVSAGAYIRGVGDGRYADARHTFSRRGVLTGNSSITSGRPNGNGIEISGLHTDRMSLADFEHRATGSRMWNVSNSVLGRGGREQNHGTADAPKVDNNGNWAIRVDSPTASPTAPIKFSDVNVQIGVDDTYPSGVDRNIYSSPNHALVVGKAGPIFWDGGVLAGVVAPVRFASTNTDQTVLHVTAHTVVQRGTVDSPTWTTYGAYVA